jgi:outer membrane protein
MKALCALALALIALPSVAQQPLGSDRPRISGPITLQQAVDQALKGNLEIQMSHAEAEAAVQETRAARAMTGPQVSANTYLAGGSMPSIFSSAPGVVPPNSLIVPGKGYADQNLTLMVPLFTGGRLENQVKAAAGRESAARAGIGTAQADAALMVRDVYYRALLAAEMVKVAQSRLDAGRATLETTRALFEAGKGLQASVARAEAEMADAQRMETTARNDQAKMLLDLKRAMGVNLDSDITLADSLSYTSLDRTLDAALAEAGRVRPELLAARARLESAKAQTGAARGAWQPQVYGTAMGDVFAPDDMGKRTGGAVGVTLSIPLYDNGQRKGEVGRMEAMERRAEAEVKDIELRVATEIRQVWLDVDTAGQNYRTAQAAVQSAQAAYDVVVLRVQNQKSILVEQLDALAALVQARTNVAQALYDHSIAIAKLQRAIGRP